MSELKKLINTPSDINEHLKIMHDYANECSHITEMGVRDIVSSWAWLEAHPRKLVLYDFADPPANRLEQLQEYARINEIDLTFIKADVLEVDIEETDLLFIDTAHHYDQLKRELELHAPNTKKYIILHDTEFFKDFGADSKGNEYDANGIRYKGLWPAIEEFLSNNTDWTIKERMTNNWGLTILVKKQ
jgi:hypothetical protein